MTLCTLTVQSRKPRETFPPRESFASFGPGINVFMPSARLCSADMTACAKGWGRFRAPVNDDRQRAPKTQKH
jgi:hypothetical protein